jgi:hypothetical protein
MAKLNKARPLTFSVIEMDAWRRMRIDQISFNFNGGV